ncbi:hypothetical protein RND81_12G026100 [Saponaria officinalis]|uniref:Uncharacterized protein n=1 Tax=Saponaria officinalis TaxID=3572 RepID=A0AAW1H4R5_SAPOF
MAENQIVELEYMADEQDVVDLIDEMVDEYNARYDGNVGANEYDLVTKMTDTLAANARQGKDIQGIPWDMLDVTREKYRLEQYKNYENIPGSGDSVSMECKAKEKGGTYYEFFYNSRTVKPTILHFQLRNLVWASSKHDVYFMSNYQVMHWSALSQNLTEIINFAEHVAPSEKHKGNLLEGFTQTPIITLAAKDRLMVAGGFQGELLCKHLDKPGVSFCARTTSDDNAITNAVEIYHSVSGGYRFMASNNDCGIREYDMERYQLLSHFRFPWPVNEGIIWKLINVGTSDFKPLKKARVVDDDNVAKLKHAALAMLSAAAVKANFSHTMKKM